MLRKSAFASIVVSIALGCGPAEAPQDSDAMQAAPAPMDQSIDGQYEVTGVTIDKTTEAQRPISGKVVINRTGDRYTAHFEFATVFPGSLAVAAEIVGTGEGSVEGRKLKGVADTQIVLASVPGVDVGFAMVPRDVGPRIVSSSVAEFFDDGTVRIEIENEPAKGAEYSPTRTILVGYRPESAPAPKP